MVKTQPFPAREGKCVCKSKEEKTMLNKTEIMNKIKQDVEAKLDGYTVGVKIINANNSAKEYVLLVEDEKKNVAHITHLENYLSAYERGKNLEDIVEDIVEVFSMDKSGASFDEGIENLTHFDWVKKHLYCTLINMERNNFDKSQFLLTPIPKTDLLVKYKILIGTKGDIMSTIDVTRDMLKKWEISPKEFHQVAMESSKKIMPEKIFTLSSIMAMQFPMFEIKPLPPQMEIYALTNERMCEGASVILYSDVLEQVAKKTNSDLYVFPSSIHEMLAVNIELGDIDTIKDLVRTTNISSVDAEEQLSDYTYYYNRETKELSIVS